MLLLGMIYGVEAQRKGSLVRTSGAHIVFHLIYSLTGDTGRKDRAQKKLQIGLKSMFKE
jgi:hypothetical protein